MLSSLAFSPAAMADRVLEVGHDSGAFASVQAAVDAATAGGEAATIRIAAGTWRGVVDVPSDAPALRFIGAGATQTRIVHDHYASRIDPRSGQPFGTYGSATMFVRADDFHAERLTIANDAGPVGQAVALVVDGTRASFRDVHLLGHQDTLYLRKAGTLVWFRDCRVEGTVDYIFGAATALFERCALHSVGDGYITAPSTPPEQAYGFVFRDCTLTAAPGVAGVYLGRPWRPHGAAYFVGCRFDGPVLAEGWHDWGKPGNRQTARFAEFGNSGRGSALDGRVSWRLDDSAPPDAVTLMQDWKPFE
ncbi:pectin esterase [Luteimonas chenhongjianii]|uniref:Pectinesterase n=1 Tax=Luteimonas chenhongjianii TaxID=2006110 RepID=A0A290XHL8_9GAMM|nr:pectinesterase family protein [Luteimonas chenhongjianii]ATD68508.1 pectin esterase [Luteimonas chenhongjianii]